MDLLIPDASQRRPTFAQARAMCEQVSLEFRPLLDSRLISVLTRLRENYANGGALFATFQVGESKVFDWFASREQLVVFGILRQLLDRNEVRSALPELEIEGLRSDDPSLVVRALSEYGPVDGRLAAFGIEADSEVGNHGYEGELEPTSSFFFDAELARKLHAGGCYIRPGGNGRVEREGSLAFCEALFGLRFAEVAFYATHSPWTPWFGNIGEDLDWTAILFDRRSRTLSVLVTTDTD